MYYKKIYLEMLVNTINICNQLPFSYRKRKKARASEVIVNMNVEPVNKLLNHGPCLVSFAWYCLR